MGVPDFFPDFLVVKVVLSFSEHIPLPMRGMCKNGLDSRRQERPFDKLASIFLYGKKFTIAVAIRAEIKNT